MLCKIILLCCILIAIVAGVPKPVKFKTCKAIGGRCIKAPQCPEQDVLRTVCNRVKSDESRVCCAGGKKKRGNVGKKRGSKGCRQKHRCSKIGGRCIPVTQVCQEGKVKKGVCKKGICQCCILKRGDTTETKFRRGKKRINPRKENKKDKGCKKKKSCKGFCVVENEECLGESDPKGCKGNKCSCCTLGGQNEEKKKEILQVPKEAGYEYDYSGNGYSGNGYSGDTYSGDIMGEDYLYHDYYYDYYDGKKCFEKNINGSCNHDCFTCGDGQCYPAWYRCDKFKHCEDSSDEVGCPHPAPESCPREYAWVLTSCYKFVASSSSWSNSRMVCQALNGDLALIYDNALFAAYMKAFQEIEKAVYWVGIHPENGTYTWVNGTLLPENSSLWGTTKNRLPGNNGAEDCVVMDFFENQLQPTSCEKDTYNDKSIYSICEYLDNDHHANYYDYYY